MNTHVFSRRLKITARGQLFNRIGTVIGAFLMHMAIYLPLPFFLSYLNTSTIINLMIYFVISFLISIYSGILMTGESLIYLKVVTGQEPAVSDLFYGFKNQTGRIILLRLIPALVLMLTDIPAFIISERLSSVLPDTSTMLSLMQSGDYETIMKLSYDLYPVTSKACLVFLAQFLITLAVNVIFSQTLFYMLDYPELDAGEVLIRSISLLRGNWGKYLYLILSFIPWYVLGIFTLYFSFLWSFPYKWTTMADFYMELVKEKSGQRTENVVDIRI